MTEPEPKLTPGNGFFLEPTGQWSVKKIPPEVLKKAEFSGYLTIDGYRSSVFEMPDKSQWAQKSMRTPVVSFNFVKMAARIAEGVKSESVPKSMEQDDFASAVMTALDKAKAMEPEARVGETFAVENEDFWNHFESEMVLEFPDDGENIVVTVIHKGDGEPTDYRSDINSFDPKKAYEAAVETAEMITGE